MNGKITNYLKDLVCKQLYERGIVVWYDPQQAYKHLVQRFDLPETALLRYEEGFFRLREQLESYLECVTEDGKLRPDADRPPRVVLYVPMDREESRYALIEAETAGVVMEPGAPRTECNTRLGLLAEKVFEKIAPAKAAHLARQADDGLLTLDELDRMAEDAGAVATGALQVIFGHASAEEIILQFIALDTRDKAIEEKNALADLMAFLREEIGFEAPACQSAGELRAPLRRYALSADLLLEIPHEDMPEALRRLPLPEKAVQRDLIRHVCAVWRNRVDLKELYVPAAETVEKALGFGAVELPPACLRAAETFSSIERRWLDHAAAILVAGHAEEAVEVANVRSSLFWAKEIPAFQLEWRVIETAANVCLDSARIDEDLKKTKWTLDEMIDAYTGHAMPWMRLDGHARHLDARYASLESLDSGAEGLEKAVILARQRYANTLNALSSSYASAARDAEFTSKRFGHHPDVFKTAVRPFIDQGLKTAYFLVDALRYEMACELIEGFTADYENRIEPVLGQLPGITSVGMAALLPGADQGLSLEKKGTGFSVSISGHALPTRQARLAWLQEKAGVPVAAFKLGEVVKLTPKRKKEIEAARLIVVTSQEIDRLGEDAADEDETRSYMEEVLEKARRAMRALVRAGVRQFVISADHGFQLLDSMDPGLSMNPPGGDTLELHPRVWIGQGGGTGDGFLRLKASDLELGGSLEFAFPRGLGTFKVKGGVGTYFHGGISPQEHILPLVRVKAPKAGRSVKTDLRIKVSMSKTKITNRIFTVTIEAEAQGLFPGAEKRVRIEAIYGKETIGQAVVAGYGFEESTREIRVVPGKPNVVTMMLGPGAAPGAVTVQVWDCESQLVLDTIKDIPVELGI